VRLVSEESISTLVRDSYGFAVIFDNPVCVMNRKFFCATV